MKRINVYYCNSKLPDCQKYPVSPSDALLGDGDTLFSPQVPRFSTASRNSVRFSVDIL